MSYKLPNLSLEQFRLLPADEQYLLISNIHALYERMLTTTTALPPINNVVPMRPAPSPPRPATRQRAFRRGSSSAYIMEIFLEAGDAALTPEEIYRRVSAKTQTTQNAIWRVLAALVQQGVLEKDGDGRAGGRYHLKR